MMKKKYFEKTLLAGLLMTSGSAFALPALQLDISGGTYDLSSETIVKSGSSFDVYAFATPQGNLSSSEIKGTQYYLSAALTGPNGLVPQQGQNLGSFSYTIGSITTAVNVTSGLVFGTPPLDEFFQNASNVFDNGDLSKHSIFPTYFKQIALDPFTDSQQIVGYNTATRPGGPLTTDAGTGTFYQKISFNLAGLASGYDLHWDLYSTKVATNSSDVNINDFAPYSHDAESIRDNNPPPPPPDENVPEPTALWMLGLGLLGLAGFKRKQSKLAA
ncbi:MAG: choice-of-anchor N protein [Methylococcaceae bacterium]|nr:choice-of-anchor N protein [Methylococcaceae bacterium]MDP3018371.1 choice-of-anchor N protein [Methylococcaceae bacterium]MDP3389319.1 choice-of-anchor N protein [Methylococcaceae bacterium]MDP3932111.1 choice-of-anchor N protein [Methylococcaceae bacterium]MDZ4156787.1 choice-of-anchor N protein [Methylococcales bacterium]